MYAYIEKRGQFWCVIYTEPHKALAIVGRYTAKYKAQAHADRINDNIADDR